MGSLQTKRWPGSLAVALAGAALTLLLQAVQAVPPALEYRRDLLLEQPWRLISAHVVHINWTHALVNAGAWLVLARLFEVHVNAKQQLLCLVGGGLSISIALALLYPSIAWYRGASGMLHALYFAGAIVQLADALHRRSRRTALLAAGLLAGGAMKIVLELPRGAFTPYAEWLGAATVPQAHLFGALSGATLGLLFAANRPGSTSLNR